MLVKIGVYTNIGGSHHFLGKLFYFFDSPWSSSLESAVKNKQIIHLLSNKIPRFEDLQDLTDKCTQISVCKLYTEYS